MIAFCLSFVGGQLWPPELPVPVAALVFATAAWLAASVFAAANIEQVARCFFAALAGAFLAVRALIPPGTGCVLPEPGRADKAWLQAVLLEDPFRFGTDSSVDVHAAIVHGPRLEPVCGTVRITLPENDAELRTGDRISVHVTLRRPRSFANPGRYDQVAALARQGIWVTAYARTRSLTLLGHVDGGWSEWIARERARIGARIDASLPDVEAALLRALVIGDTSRIPRDLQDQVRRSGMAHLLSVSGLHIGVVWGLGFAIVHWLGARSERVLLETNLRAIAGVAAGPMAIFYGALAGGRLPTGRSVVMTLLLTIATACGREIWPLRALTLAAAVLCVHHPGCAADPSFQLSFVSVAALVLGAGWWSARRSPERPATAGSWRDRLALACIIPAAAILGTAPLTALHFNQIAPAGVLSNPILVPICGVPATVLGLAGAACSFFSERAAGVVFGLAFWPLMVFRKGVALAAAMPAGSVRVPTPTILEIVLAYGFLLLPWCPVRRRIAIASVLVSILVVDATFWIHDRYLDRHLRVRFLDVGQGDATVVELPGGRVLVVDGGGFAGSRFDVGERVVARYLRTRRILSVDALVATHGDWDHQGGLHALAREFSPRELWRNGEGDRFEALDTLVRAAGGIVRIPYAGEVLLEEGGVKIECFHPPPAGGLSSNDASLVLRVSMGTVSILLPGDIEAAAERLLLAAGKLERVTVLKAPHHGSRTSSTAAFLAKTRPKLAIASVGAANRYGFPHETVVRRYALLDAPLYRTDEDGSIAVVTDGRRLRVRSFARSPAVFCRLTGALC